MLLVNLMSIMFDACHGKTIIIQVMQTQLHQIADDHLGVNVKTESINQNGYSIDQFRDFLA